MNLFSALQDPAATKMRQAVRLFAEALLELAAEPEGAAAAQAVADASPPAVAGEEPAGPAPVIKERSAPIVAAARARASSSEEKLPLLRQHAGTMPLVELEKVVGLKKSTLYRLAKKHGLQLATPEHRLKIDLDELRRLAPATTVPELMRRFGCTDSAIRLAAKANDITLLAQPRAGGRPAVEWSDDMLATLRAKAGKVPAAELMAELGVNRNPLFLKAKTLGLSLAMAWTPERSAELAGLAGTMTSAQLAAHFHVTLYSLAEEVARQGIGRVAEPKPKKERPARQVAEVSEAIDAVPSTLTEGGWVEGQAAVASEGPAIEAEPPVAPVLEGISYTITTPDRRPASPELIEALQPVVEAAAKAMRAEKPERAAPVTAAVEERLERLRDEQAGRSMLAFEPLPAAKRRAAPRPRATSRARIEPESKWVRLQHPDGRWLRMDGLGWVEKKADGFQVLRTKLEAVLKAFPLARECKVVSEAAWSPKDILYAETVR